MDNEHAARIVASQQAAAMGIRQSIPSATGFSITWDAMPDIEGMIERPGQQCWKPSPDARFWLDGKEIDRKTALAHIETMKPPMRSTFRSICEKETPRGNANTFRDCDSCEYRGMPFTINPPTQPCGPCYDTEERPNWTPRGKKDNANPSD